MLGCPIATDVRIALEQAYDDLGRGAVAIRSSATQEDLAAASFAGQYDTYLGVCEASDVADRVRACWSSLYTPHAIRYRAERGLDQTNVSMAVVIQRMLDPELSGVIFTRNPVTGSTDEIHITAAYGLGEPLVDGRVSPDTLVFRGRDLRLAYAEVGEKTVMVCLAPTGGLAEVPVPAERSQALGITEQQARQVARLATRVAAQFGAPQEIEWAAEDGQIFLLQSRPMVLSPRDEPKWQSPIDGAHWRRGRRVGEWLSGPVTPLFATSLLPALVDGRERFGAGHLGWDQPGTFSMLKPWFCIVNGYLYYRGDRDPASMDWPGGTPFINDAEQAPEPLAHGDAPAEDLQARIEGAIRRSEERHWLQHWRRRHWPAYGRRFRRLQRFDPRRVPATGCLAFLEEIYRDAAEWWYLLARIGYGHEHGFQLLYDHLVTDPKRPANSSFTAGYDGRGLESQRRLYAVYQEVDRDPWLRRLFVDEEPFVVLTRLSSDPRGAALFRALESFLATHGHQIFSLDFSIPTLGERPGATVAALQSYLRQRPDPPAGSLASLQRRRRLAARSVQRRLKDRPDERRAFEDALKWVQACAAVRENAMYDFQRLWPLMRRVLRELGERLVAVGALDRPDDVFFLEQPELVATAQRLDAGRGVGRGFQPVIEERRAEHERQSHLNPPDWIPPLRARAEAQRGHGLVDDETGRRLVGQGASPGQARGPARLVKGPEEFRGFRRGDVLVAVATTPAWSVLFPLAAAIVTEVGGIPSHASVVAREYGIPAVFGTGTATQVIRDGQIVIVDGSSGVVWLSTARETGPI
jgi:pyruvate,water dikinase